jgi:hypothetical protein
MVTRRLSTCGSRLQREYMRKKATCRGVELGALQGVGVAHNPDTRTVIRSRGLVWVIIQGYTRVALLVR